MRTLAVALLLFTLLNGRPTRGQATDGCGATAPAAADHALIEEAFHLHPATGYAETWKASYARALNPIRFVGEGVQGRVQFYYLGMGKAYLLDLLNPDWKAQYMNHHLDDLLAQ